MNNLEKDINNISPKFVSDLNRDVSKMMDKSALFYRSFARVKTSRSVQHKFNIKNYNSEKKMQDLFGVRIALYFKDDIPICQKIIESTFNVVDISKDMESETVFEPVRLNYVCKLPSDIRQMMDEIFWSSYPIDDTFEIQVRTVFSEGWHEIEHDLRYKCKNDWINENDMNRTMNGIFATLETCDWSILSLFEQITYKKYKDSNWIAMIRNKFRIRFNSESLDKHIVEIFNSKREMAKEYLKLDREKLILALCSNEISRIPKTMSNIIFISNSLFVNDSDINKITPRLIQEKCGKYKLK